MLTAMNCVLLAATAFAGASFVSPLCQRASARAFMQSTPAAVQGQDTATTRLKISGMT